MLAPLPGPPRHIGPYRLLALVGAGGMGEVYLAREEAPEPGLEPGPKPEPGLEPVASSPARPRLVAVKTVRADLDIDREFRIRFRREIAAARAVSGAGTAALLDGDADAEVPWLATEYVAGPALAETVARCGPLPPAAVRAVGARLARALAAVHAARVLHRDLKPGNVLLTSDGPRLIDFGIAQAFEATALTAAGMLVGTPGFMAPEQIEGSHAVVPASDVFTLGAVLAYAATGRGPFDDEELAAVIFRITQGDADLSGVPEESGLRETVAACLAPDPGERPTAAELASRLGMADGSAPAVPWPAEVLSLFAEHREAVARCEREAAEASFAQAPTATSLGAARPTPAPAPTPPSTSTSPPTPTVDAIAPAPSPRRRWPWIAAAVVAAAAVTVAAVLLPGDSGGSGGGGGDEAGGGGGGKKDAPARIVTAYGNPGHSGEFGSAAARADSRPQGWKPWSVRLPKGLDSMGGGCVLVADTLVCRDGKGAAAALDAATGRHKWTTPGFKAAANSLDGVQTNGPESDGRSVFVPSQLGITKVDLASGRERWRKRLPADAGLLTLTVAQGVVYSAEYQYETAKHPYRTIIRARRASDGDQLWESEPLPKTQGALLLAGGAAGQAAGEAAGETTRETTRESAGGDAGGATEARVVTSLESGGVATLSARTGRTVRTATSVSCDDVLAHGADLLCWGGGRKGVRVLDAATLAPRRTLAPGTEPDGPAPVVGERGVLVLATRNPDGTSPVDHRLTGYDYRSGRKLWRFGSPQELGPVALAGRRVIAIGAYDMWGLDTSGDPDRTRTKSVPETDADKPVEAVHGSLAAPLFLGGAVFGETDTGKIVSGYAP
ncbi:serine/threonine-protein kinase [Streptomyces sp. NPDC059009]|uniref:serine/threonine-protein kinase n=1 Tax=Streptomyces sp. NPDC059009 TaxID=3346694 RepID=UPI0036BA491A